MSGGGKGGGQGEPSGYTNPNTGSGTTPMEPLVNGLGPITQSRPPYNDFREDPRIRYDPNPTPSGMTTQEQQDMRGYAPPSDVYSQAASNYNNATGLTNAGAALYGTTGPIANGMGMYQNPYENQVVQGALGDIEQQRRAQQVQNQASAAQSGAFGGSRHGVVESLTNAAAQQNAGNTGANLRSQGFNTASQLANQDIQNRFGAGAGLYNAGAQLGNIGGQQFGMGQQIGQNQWTQGALAQGIQQMLLDQSQGMFNQYVNQPTNLLSLRNQAVGLSPLVNANTVNSSGSSTGTGPKQYNPGLFDYLSLGAQTYGMSKMGR